MKTYLITGCCGTGKTWVMNELIKHFNLVHQQKIGLYSQRINEDNSVVAFGIYDGTTFEGSDRLSMAVMSDNQKMLDYLQHEVPVSVTVIAEGDRFTNSSFIRDFKPFIIKIDGDGSKGRLERGSNQSKEHLQRITTRVNNTGQDVIVKDSECCLNYIVMSIVGGYIDPAWIVTQPPSAMDMFLK